jgi:hypothetical protein
MPIAYAAVDNSSSSSSSTAQAHTQPQAADLQPSGTNMLFTSDSYLLYYTRQSTVGTATGARAQLIIHYVAPFGRWGVGLLRRPLHTGYSLRGATQKMSK